MIRLITPLIRHQKDLSIERNLCVAVTSKFRKSRMLSTEVDSDTTNNLIVVGQMRSTNDKEHNKGQVKEIVRRAHAEQAKVVFLPECCDYVGTTKEETLSLSESLTGDLMSYYRSLAIDYKIWLSIGGFHERATDGLVSNSHVVINSSGVIVDCYRKLHMFDVTTPTFKFQESKVVRPGQEIRQPLETPVGLLGLMICYDVRFPELSTILMKRGAELLTYPSAFAFTTGEAHWESLLRTRAIENQCFVVAAAQIGFHNAKRQSYGHAMIVDPWGTIIAHCDPTKDLDIGVGRIDRSRIDRIRLNMPCLAHRRNDMYSLTAIGSFRSTYGGKWDDRNDFLFSTHPVPWSTIFYETEHCVAFTNLRCAVIGHVLVATKRCVVRLTELQSDEITDLFQTACFVQRILEQYHRTEAATVTVQDGALAGQTVKHVHCHVMPRRQGDFTANDDIYKRIAEHDSKEEEARTPPRTLDERSAEANGYRQLIGSI